MTVTDVELSVRGKGQFQICYLCPNIVKKSAIYKYNVYRAIDANGIINPVSQDTSDIINSLAEIQNKIGNLDLLVTNNKENLVQAINGIITNNSYIVQFDTIGSLNNNPNCTCRKTFSEVSQAISSGAFVIGKEYVYSSSTNNTPYRIIYHKLIAIDALQIRFGQNGLQKIDNQDSNYGAAWIITAPYIVFKSDNTVIRNNITNSPAMMGDINALSSRVSTLETESFGIVENINMLSNTVESLGEGFSEIENSIDVESNRITILETETSEIQNNVNQLSEDVSTSENNIETLFDKTFVLQTASSEINNNLNTLSGKITTLQTNSSTINNNLNTLSSKVTTLQTKSSELQDDITDLSNEINNIVIDSQLSSSSTNSVQNRVIYAALDSKAGKDTATTSAAGLMSASDKVHLEDVYDDYSSMLQALGVI